MNKHFEDAQYYLKRAAETAGKGINEELTPIRERFQTLIGEDDPEPTGIEKVREELTDLQSRAEGEAKEAISQARDRLETYRNERSAEAE